MLTIIGSSGRNCVLIILFQLYSSKAGLFENNLILVGQYEQLQQLSFFLNNEFRKIC